MEQRFARFISFLTGFALFALYAPAFLMMLGSCSDTSDTFPIFGNGGAGGTVIVHNDAGPCPETTASSSSSSESTTSSSSSSSSGSLPPDPAQNPCNCADKSIFDACGEDDLGNCHSHDGQASQVLSCWYRCIDKVSGQMLNFNSCPNPCTLQLGNMKTFDPYP